MGTSIVVFQNPFEEISPLKQVVHNLLSTGEELSGLPAGVRDQLICLLEQRMRIEWTALRDLMLLLLAVLLLLLSAHTFSQLPLTLCFLVALAILSYRRVL